MQDSVLKARQMKAARALLDWSQENLASVSGLSIATIRKLELGYISPRSQTIQAIQYAFENSGLEFIEPNGIRQRPDDITIYQGRNGFMDFYDDVYSTIRRKSGEIVIVCPNPNVFYADPEAFYKDMLQEYRDTHVSRMSGITEKIPIKCIFTDDKCSLETVTYANYRQISKHYVDSVPFYVYDDKYAISITEPDSSSKVVVLRSRSVADAFRKQFYSMWEKATPISKNNNENKKKRGR